MLLLLLVLLLFVLLPLVSCATVDFVCVCCFGAMNECGNQGELPSTYTTGNHS